MSTVAEAPPEVETAVEPEFVGTREYISVTNNLKLVRDPIRKKQLGEGADFTVTQGEHVQFLDGRYSSTDPDEIAWLDEHPQNGILFHQVGLGAEGNAADDSAAVIRAVIGLAFKGNYAQVADVLVKERNTYRRPDVIAACESALNEVGQISPNAL